MNHNPLFGSTRTIVKDRYALIAPDGHVPSIFPRWEGATAFVMLSPRMGAGLTQLLITFDPNHDHPIATFLSNDYEHAIYVETGTCDATTPEGTIALTAGGFVFVPPHTALTLAGSGDARVTVFRKKYEPARGIEAPPLAYGNLSKVKGEPFLGFKNAILHTLLPIDDRFDFAMNVFVYQPGATLPFVETHIMEHGLLMLAGQGIYRLGEDYYPVQKGDVIWMAPYCPQWFVAMGDQPASYLYCKDIHRLP
jgi:(S)-ureidoglycine aminohydrolase